MKPKDQLFLLKKTESQIVCAKEKRKLWMKNENFESIAERSISKSGLNCQTQTLNVSCCCCFYFTVMNAENAAHKSEKFSAMATRTRHEYLKDLATNFITNTTLETGAKGKGTL